MVVNIATIPLHIQKLIAEKMNFNDFKIFKQSSKHGRDSGYTVRPTANVQEVIIRRENIEIKCSHFSENRLFAELRMYDGCPRISAHTVYIVDDIEDDRYAEIINEVEDGWLSGCCSKFCFQVNDPGINPEDFNNLLEVFKVKYLFAPALPIHFMQLPAVRKIQFMELYLPMDDSHLLALKCPGLTTELDSATINNTMNRFFKQWLDDERIIVDVEITDMTRTNRIDPDIMLYDLPYNLLWSPMTHKASTLAHVRKYSLKHPANCYSIRNGTRMLFVQVYTYSLKAREVINEQDALYKAMMLGL